MHFSYLILAFAGFYFSRLVAAQDLPERFPNWNCISVQQPPSEEWIFYPVNGTDPQQNAATEKAIRGIIGDYEIDRYISDDEGLLFWWSNVTATQACAIEKLKEIAAVEENIISAEPLAAIDIPSKLQPRAPVWTTQVEPVTELRIISQPTNVPDIRRFKNYVYDAKAGEGTYIYMVEDGINTEPDDLKDRVDPEWIYGPDARRKHPGKTDDSLEFSGPGQPSQPGHSTCAASKAGGKIYGVAKKATIIAVKMELNAVDIGAIFDRVYHDIVNKDRKKKSVVNISWGSRPKDIVPAHWIKARQWLQKLTDNDIVVVAGAGNYRKESGREQIDLYPQQFTSDTLPIINVGNSNYDGTANGDTQIGPKLHVWAAAEPVTCSKHIGTDSRRARGTSYAAPQVSGLIAYFLSLDNSPISTANGETAINARDFVRDTASWRREDDSRLPNVAWNLVDDKLNPPSP